MKKLILLFYLCWVIPTIAFYYIPIPENISSFQMHLTLFLFTGAYLLLASSLAYRIILAVVEGRIRQHYLYGFICLFVFFLLYIYRVFFPHNIVVVAAFSTANLLFAASLLGALLSSAVKRVGELVPVCFTAAIADLVSVLKGPTKSMIEDITTYYEEGMEGIPPLVDFIIIKAGIPGVDIPVPLFGVTDWVLLVLLSSAMIRMHQNDNVLGSRERYGNFMYLPVSSLALFAGLIFAQITQLFVPAMVFIALFFLVYLAVRLNVIRELKRVDILYSLIFPAIVWVSIVVIGV